MVKQSRLSLAPGVLVEDLGSLALIYLPGTRGVVRVTGLTAETLNAVVAGQLVTHEQDMHVQWLIDAGILTGSVSRRSFLRAGAFSAGAGIAILALPSAAVASSSGDVPINTTRFRVNVEDPGNSGGYVTGFYLRVREGSAVVTFLPLDFPGTVILSGGGRLTLKVVQVGIPAATENDDDVHTLFRWVPSTPQDLPLSEWENLTHILEFTFDGVLYRDDFPGIG